MQQDIDYGDIAIKRKYSDYQFSPDYITTYTGKMKLRIRELRVARRLTQVQLAEKMGITQPHLSEMERGEAEVNTHRLTQFAECLAVEPYELLLDINSTADGRIIAAIRGLSAENRQLVASLVESLSPIAK